MIGTFCLAPAMTTGTATKPPFEKIIFGSNFSISFLQIFIDFKSLKGIKRFLSVNFLSSLTVGIS